MANETLKRDSNYHHVVGGITDDANQEIRQLRFDPVTGAAYFAAKGYSTLGDGRKTIALAGTREALVAVSTPCKEVTITALESNTGTIVVGSTTTVVAALATRRGAPLGPTDSIPIRIDDLNKVGLDATVSGDGVSYIYFV